MVASPVVWAIRPSQTPIPVGSHRTRNSAVGRLHCCPSVNAVHRINGSGKFGNTEQPASDIDIAELPVAKLAHVARPSSLHAGGVNMSFADGASRFISDTIDYRVYQALLTPHGVQSDVPQPDFVITEEF